MKRENKKEILKREMIFFIFISLSLAMISLVSADSQFNVCCEKTLDGAWCQNSLPANCDPEYKNTSTSCDATSYCKQGCCVDPNEGLCMENTPEKVCNLGGGTWFDDNQCAISQCKLGCCILGDQASFVTLTRCKTLSSFYGLTTNFRRDVPDEASCVLLTHSQDKGACVFEVDGQKTCKFGTMAECLDQNKTSTSETDFEFHKDYLCSALELGTNCGPSKQTTCIDGDNEVYFLDTCGNPANIYDANRQSDPAYWEKIVKKADSCGATSTNGNAKSKTCGNCEYFKGSTCGTGVATYGNYACKDLDCYNTHDGKNHKNGESWCIYQKPAGNGTDTVGSRHFRYICMDGEEIVEPCADFRNEICISNKLQTTEGDFEEAACRVNRWQDCVDQNTPEKCFNIDQRDCYWTNGLNLDFIRSNSTTGTATTSSNNVATFQGNSAGSTTISMGSSGTSGLVSGVVQSYGSDVCLPTVPPGLKFWNNGDAQSVCRLGNAQCIVTFNRNIRDLIGNVFGEDNRGNCVDNGNCSCLDQSWVEKANKVCTSLGDCGAYTNVAGAYTGDGVEWHVNGDLQDIEGGLLSSMK